MRASRASSLLGYPVEPRDAVEVFETLRMPNRAEGDTLVVDGRSGNDSIDASGVNVADRVALKLVGGLGNDTLVGSPFNDVLDGGLGDDTYTGGLGLDTCPQAAFCDHHVVVRRVLGLRDDQVMVCGMSLGFEDKAEPTNALVTERAKLADFVTFGPDA